MADKIKREFSFLFKTSAQSENGKRATWLDMARGFAILLVVIGHRGYIYPETSGWISTFHLATFFVISGILLFWKEEDSSPLKVTIGKRAKGILIPYLWFSLGSNLLDIIQGLRSYYASLEMPLGASKWDYFPGFFDSFFWMDVKNNLISTVTLQGCSVLWFLPACFFAELFVLLLLKWLGKGWKGKILLAVITTVAALVVYNLYILIWRYMVGAGYTDFWDCLFLEEFKCFSRVWFAAAFMSYGGLLVKFLKQRTRFCWWELLMGIVLMVPGVAVTRTGFAYDMNHLTLHWSPIFLLLGVCGALGVLLICKNCINIPPLTYLGRNSLIIMATHMNFYVMYVGSILGQFCENHIGSFGHAYFSLNLYSMVFTFLLQIPVIMVINLFLPFVMGRKYRH